jgi:hypothetical protein
LTKWRTGKKSPMRASHDSSSSGKNTPEMKRTGKRMPLTIAGAASALGTTPEMAMPSAAKVMAPTSSDTSSAGQCPGNSKS